VLRNKLEGTNIYIKKMELTWNTASRCSRPILESNMPLFYLCLCTF